MPVGNARPSGRVRSDDAPASVTRSTTSYVSGPALVMIVVRKLRGGVARMFVSVVSAALRSSGLSLAARFRSNRTSSLPFGGSNAYSPEMTARVLTVKSTTDWKVSIGGRRVELAGRLGVRE